MKPDFIMTFGISGSGKSTHINKNKDDRLVVSPDDIRRELLGNVSDQSKTNIIWERAIGRIEGILLSGNNVILDATNTKFSEWRDFVLKLPKCRKIAWVFKLDPKIANDRVNEDLRTGVDRAVVPTETIYKQYGCFQYTLTMLPIYFDKIVNICSADLT